MSEFERSVFAGYRVEAVVGRGGMGVVYRATQLRLRRNGMAVRIVLAGDADTLGRAAARAVMW